MRIALVATLNERVPPLPYGGTGRVVSYLTEQLVRHVTLFASGDSETSARLVPACPRALWRDLDVRETLPHHMRFMELVFRDVGRFGRDPFPLGPAARPAGPAMPSASTEAGAPISPRWAGCHPRRGLSGPEAAPGQATAIRIQSMPTTCTGRPQFGVR
jgi:hypothetical protein